MFFVASKVFWTLAQPISVIALLVLAGLLLAWWGRRRLASVANLSALLLLGVLCFTNVGGMLLLPLEDRFERPTTRPETISAIIVLGGATESVVSGSRGTAELNAAGERMTAALVLARAYPDAPIVFSGGVALLAGQSETEAATAERFFLEQGIDASRLILENQARNTAENAALVSDLFSTGDAPALLVTSAFHIPRSMGLFRKAGLNVIAWPVDYRTIAGAGLALDIGDPVENLEDATTALREWVGLVAYWLTDRIDAPYPGPEH